MSRIEKVETVPFRVPLTHAVEFATGSLNAATHILVRVTDSDGAIGTAEVIPRPMIYGDTLGSTLRAYEDEICPRVIGLGVDSTERVHAALAGLVANYTAKAGLELALFDLVARRLGVSCHALLGGFTDSVRVAAILGYGKPADVAAEAVSYRERYGIEAFKVKAGRGVAVDSETCRAVRAAVGADAFIWVDVNHGYDVLDALAFDRAVADAELAWVEEPTPAEQPLDRLRVVREGRLTVLGDESVPGPGDVAREVLAGRCEAVSLKVGRSGYLDADRIRGFCEAAGVPILSGSQGESAVGTLACLAYAAAHPSTVRYPTELSYFLKLEADLLTEPLTVRDGRLTVPDRPGNGVEIDERTLDRYRLSMS